MHSLHLALNAVTRRRQKERAELRMIAIIRSGIIFGDVQGVIPQPANGAPIKGSEMDQKIRRNLTQILINLLRPEDKISHWIAEIVGKRQKTLLHFAQE